MDPQASETVCLRFPQRREFIFQAKVPKVGDVIERGDVGRITLVLTLEDDPGETRTRNLRRERAAS